MSDKQTKQVSGVDTSKSSVTGTALDPATAAAQTSPPATTGTLLAPETWTAQVCFTA